jgi:hypothetical protein
MNVANKGKGRENCLVPHFFLRSETGYLTKDNEGGKSGLGA